MSEIEEKATYTTGSNPPPLAEEAREAPAPPRGRPTEPGYDRSVKIRPIDREEEWRVEALKLTPRQRFLCLLYFGEQVKHM